MCAQLYAHRRCLVLLAVPQFCSKRGRHMLVAYVFVICVTGPVANTTRNTELMVQSLACDQRLVQQISDEIVTILKRPLVAIRRVVDDMLKHLDRVIVKLRALMLRMRECVMVVVGVISRAFAFLASAANVCNEDIGTPFERCSGLFEVAHEDCR